jgi:hypothetical protein
MSVWQKYPDLTEPELHRLVAASVQVLLEHGDSQLAASFVRRPTALLARDACEALPAGEEALDPDEVYRVLQSWEASSQLARLVLEDVRARPQLAGLVADAYERAEREMDVSAALQALALVVLALRVKNIKIKSNSITFYHTPKLESLIVELIRRLLRPGDE